jgi:sigma factor-binding protein Crl
MSALESLPAHGRLVTKFASIGPYLRQAKSSETEYFFDCLSSCISAKKDPDCREFWGWWWILTPTEEGFSYRYEFGRFDAQSRWIADKVPQKHSEMVIKTLNDFHTKLSLQVVKEWELALTPENNTSEPPLSGA